MDLKQEAEHWICPENALLRGLKALTNGVSKAITRGFRNQDDQPSVHLTRENPLDDFASGDFTKEMGLHDFESCVMKALITTLQMFVLIQR